ncbi:MAG: glutamate synthase [Nitrososphaerota archaeon]|nr:glutamate synthase [Nitrososphaerota archaeon]
MRYRGSKMGAGFACINLRGEPTAKVKLFTQSENDSMLIYRMLEERLPGRAAAKPVPEHSQDFYSISSYTIPVDAEYEDLWRAVQEVNEAIWRDGLKGRIYSWGRHVDVFKGVGYPFDVYEIFRLGNRDLDGDLWLAHTRQPTNSPGRFPFWSHPFASGEWAIVHNGDISSFGSNIELLRSIGYKSFVGTDSEVIVYLLDYLTSFQHMNVQEVAKILCNKFTLDVPDQEFIKLLYKWRGARLDGPFSVIAGFCDGHDVYLLAFADRFKFRPIIVGEDENYVYAASEEAQIRTISADARVWTIEPGDYFLASQKHGIIYPGRTMYEKYCMLASATKPHSPDEESIDASNMNYRMLNQAIHERIELGYRRVDVKNVRGQRYIGVGIDKPATLRIFGTPGNCLGNLNSCLDIEVFGNVQDDVADVMTGGRIIVHGDARDVLAQAFQGGAIYVRGNAGNRCGIQMREYRDRRPFLIIGGRVDDYLAEYMAGGVIAVLGLNYLDIETEIVGNCIASGMVGGKIYVRGDVSSSKIGLTPPRLDVLQYLRGLVLEGRLSEGKYREITSIGDLSLHTLKKFLPQEISKQVSKLYLSKYWKELVVETRLLNEHDLALLQPHLQEFGKFFNLEREVRRVIEEEHFTIIYPKTEAVTKVEEPEEG